MTLRLGLFASHGGTNLQKILDACAEGTIDATSAVVIGNNSKARAFERARLAGVPTMHLSGQTHPDADDFDTATREALLSYDVDVVVLAGYMKKLGPKTIAHYRGRILNIHPALLPRHGGIGMYGLHVHEAVLIAGESETGNTIHLVDEHYDHGATVAQASVPVLPGDTPESLQDRVLGAGHDLYVDTLARIAAGTLTLPND